MGVPSRNWNPADPANTDLVADGAQDMRDIRQDVEERFNREHRLNTLDGTDDGYHLPGSSVIYTTTSAPTLTPDGTALVSTVANSFDEGRLWKAPGGRLQVYARLTAAATGLVWHDIAYTPDEVYTQTEADQLRSMSNITDSIELNYPIGAIIFVISDLNRPFGINASMNDLLPALYIHDNPTGDNLVTVNTDTFGGAPRLTLAGVWRCRGQIYSIGDDSVGEQRLDAATSLILAQRVS